MSQGVSRAGRDYGRRRRWLAQLPEDMAPPTQSSRTQSPVVNAAETVEETRPAPPTISSILPQRPWLLGSIIFGAMASWAAVVGGGIWLDLNHVDPWRGILGLQAGSLIRFFTTVALLACAQFSYLILWRRSRSRKDFAGRYRVWIWIGVVCSVFCVASATRFHEKWASHLTSGLHLAWIDLVTLCWMVPASTMLMSAIYLLGRDLPTRSSSNAWIQSGRWMAVLAGGSLVLGSLLIPAQWLGSVQSALGALWPTVLGCGLLVYARYVTYVTNEVHRERKEVRRSRWMSRLSEFAGQVTEVAREEWQLYLARRAEAHAAKATSAPSRAGEDRNRLPPTAMTSDNGADTVQSMERRTDPAQPIPAPHFPIAGADDNSETDSQKALRSRSRKSFESPKRS